MAKNTTNDSANVETVDVLTIQERKSAFNDRVWSREERDQAMKPGDDATVLAEKRAAVTKSVKNTAK